MNASTADLRVYDAPRAARKAPGVMPVRCLKTRVQWLWSAKPASRARSVRDLPGSAKPAQRWRTLSSCKVSPRVLPRKRWTVRPPSLYGAQGLRHSQSS